MDMVATHDFYPLGPTIWMPIDAFSRVAGKVNVIWFNLLFVVMKFLKFKKKEWLKWFFLPTLLTVDSGRTYFPLHGSMYHFLVQSNEPKSAWKSTVRRLAMSSRLVHYLFEI